MITFITMHSNVDIWITTVLIVQRVGGSRLSHYGRLTHLTCSISLPFPFLFPSPILCLHLPIPIIPPYSPIPSLFFPLPPLPILTGRESGEHHSSPSGSGRSPAARRILVQFTAKNLLICCSFTHSPMQHFYDYMSCS